MKLQSGPFQYWLEDGIKIDHSFIFRGGRNRNQNETCKREDDLGHKVVYVKVG